MRGDLQDGRQLLAASQRQRRAEELDDEGVRDVVREVAAGKRSREDDVAAQRQTPDAPGKLTLADAGHEVMEPAQAIGYAEWVCRPSRVDRRADSTAQLDDGALASAFSFIEQSRGGQALPAELASQLARELDADLSEVRLHTDQRAAQAAVALGA